MNFWISYFYHKQTSFFNPSKIAYIYYRNKYSNHKLYQWYIPTGFFISQSVFIYYTVQVIKLFTKIRLASNIGELWPENNLYSLNQINYRINLTQLTITDHFLIVISCNTLLQIFGSLKTTLKISQCNEALWQYLNSSLICSSSQIRGAFGETPIMTRVWAEEIMIRGRKSCTVQLRKDSSINTLHPSSH